MGHPALASLTELWEGVPRRLRRRIRKRRYVNIFRLVAGRRADNRGRGKGKKKKRRDSAEPKVAKNILNWIRGFLRLASVVCHYQPGHYGALLAYCDSILGAYKDYEGWAWLNYDERFREKMAGNRFMSWGTQDINLWLTQMTNKCAAKIDQGVNPGFGASGAAGRGRGWRVAKRREHYQRERGKGFPGGGGGLDVCWRYNRTSCLFPECKFRSHLWWSPSSFPVPPSRANRHCERSSGREETVTIKKKKKKKGILKGVRVGVHTQIRFHDVPSRMQVGDGWRLRVSEGSTGRHGKTKRAS
ncbi:uncharacterized protein LOC115100234 [Rhinatrema bivittatum]|uniref:uncharacterized protein LOC115100234 n=1 Tax=Rhinatrema bivittatum TaxID=194408 RepID=UPI0011297E9B|nr:uncharacterized protein LOC115100234 [Rhinatrema bivittatum]